MPRLYEDFIAGTLSSSPSNTATSMTAAVFASLPVISGGDVMVLVLDPLGEAGNPEKVLVGAHASGSQTISSVTRGYEGTVARSHAAGTKVRHSWVDSDAKTVADMKLRGAFSARPAAGVQGRRYMATWAGTTIEREYYDTGAAWISLTEPYGVFNPLDFGADPTAAADSRQAFVDAIAAANAVLDDGLPYESTRVEGGIVEVTGGQYKISSGITFPAQSRIMMRGVAGSADRYIASPVISFTNGGFVVEESQANAIHWEFLTVLAVTAPALTCRSVTLTSSGPGVIRDCHLRCTGSGIPAMKLTNVFEGNFLNTTFRSVGSSTPSVIVESGDGFGFGTQGWLFRFLECRFEGGGVRWDCNGDHTTIPGVGVTFMDCYTENFAANMYLLHVRNTHATEAFTFHGIELFNCHNFDENAATGMVRLETLGTGLLQVTSIHIRSCGWRENSIKCIATGGGGINPGFVLIENGIDNPGVLFANTGSGQGIMTQAANSSWLYKASSVGTPGKAFRVRQDGKSQDYWQVDGLGRTLWSVDGTAAPDIVDTAGNGSPEGVVTSAPGGTYRRRDGGAGTCFYVKESGTGNTGWVAK